MRKLSASVILLNLIICVIWVVYFDFDVAFAGRRFANPKVGLRIWTFKSPLYDNPGIPTLFIPEAVTLSAIIRGSVESVNLSF